MAKHDKPDIVIPGKNAAWYILLMTGIIAVLTAGTVMALAAFPPEQAWVYPLAILLLAGAAALLFAPVVANRVELYPDRLVVIYGPSHTSIPYTHVHAVRRMHGLETVLAGTANSFDRVFIDAPREGCAIVSTTDNALLIAELERRMSHPGV